MARHTRGQIIIEVLIAFGLASILLPAILTGFISGRSGKVQHEQRSKAIALLKESEEAVRVFREADWNTFSTNGTFYPVVSGTSWTFSSNLVNGQIDGFTRSVLIEDAFRDGNNQVAETGFLDQSTKKVTLRISWGLVPADSITTVYYLTRWKNLTTELITTGTLINQGSGDWCDPNLNITALDLPKNGVANAIWAIQGQLAAGTGDNASGVSFANVHITDPLVPTNPVASIDGTFDGFKTNDVFTEEDYAYLATDTNSKEVEIIDLSQKDANNKYPEAGYFNAPGNGNASSVATSGNIGYMVGGNKLYSFDLSSKSGSRTAIDADGLTLPGTATRMIIWGQRAFITTNSSSSQLFIADISTPSDLKEKKRVALPSAGGAAVFVNAEGTRAFVATGTSSSQSELFIVNTDESSPQYGSVINSYDTNGMNPKGVVVVNIPRLVIVGSGAEEYQVLDISVETASPLPRCGGLQVDSGINGVSTVFTAAQRAYSYIITGDATSELKIIEGGPGGGGTGGGLTVESPVFDAGTNVFFNRIDITDVTPDDVTVTFQVAVSADCINFAYTGNYTTAGGQIPLSINPGRCFKYKATFSGGSGTGSEVSTTVVINYSP